MKLTGKTRAELAAALAGLDRQALLDLVFSLVSFERLLTAREIAEATHCNKRDVLADMKAGRFVDPIFGAGFFCRAANSFRVSASAANAWRRSFFVPVRRRDAIPTQKNTRSSSQNGIEGEKAGESAQLKLTDAIAAAAFDRVVRDGPLMPDQALHEGSAAVTADSTADPMRGARSK
jgi:hypothetical protein